MSAEPTTREPQPDPAPLRDDYEPRDRCQFCEHDGLQRGGPDRALRCPRCGALTT